MMAVGAAVPNVTYNKRLSIEALGNKGVLKFISRLREVCRAHIWGSMVSLGYLPSKTYYY